MRFGDGQDATLAARTVPAGGTCDEAPPRTKNQHECSSSVCNRTEDMFVLRWRWLGASYRDATVPLCATKAGIIMNRLYIPLSKAEVCKPQFPREGINWGKTIYWGKIWDPVSPPLVSSQQPCKVGQAWAISHKLEKKHNLVGPVGQDPLGQL